MSYKVFILDFDGIITSLNINWSKVRKEASKIAGFKIPSLIKFFENNFGTELFLKVSKLVEKYEIIAIKDAKPYPDVKRSLEVLTNLGKVIFLATMQATNPVITFLKKYDLNKYFKKILTRDMFRSKKDQLKYVLENINLPSKTVVFIDDSHHNFEICKKLELECILLEQRSNYSLYEVVANLLHLPESNLTR